MQPKVKPPGTKRLKQKSDKLLSSFAFKIDLRRYMKELQKSAPGVEFLSEELAGGLSRTSARPTLDQRNG
jgi:hypothetical protein